MIYKFTLALYNPSKGKHNSQTWDCNPLNAQLIFDHAKQTMERRLSSHPGSTIVLVKIDDQIKFIDHKID